jgi:hypothetical protein
MAFFSCSTMHRWLVPRHDKQSSRLNTTFPNSGTDRKQHRLLPCHPDAGGIYGWCCKTKPLSRSTVPVYNRWKESRLRYNRALNNYNFCGWMTRCMENRFLRRVLCGPLRSSCSKKKSLRKEHYEEPQRPQREQSQNCDLTYTPFCRCCSSRHGNAISGRSFQLPRCFSAGCKK